MPFDIANSDWRGDPLPFRPRHWLWGVMDSLKEMALVLVSLLLAFSVAFAISAAIFGLSDSSPVGAVVSRLLPASIGS